MNHRIQKLADTAKKSVPHGLSPDKWIEVYNEKLAQLVVTDVLKEVNERAYYCGDRAWSDETDRPWIEMEYGFGTLADEQRKAGIIK